MYYYKPYTTTATTVDFHPSIPPPLMAPSRHRCHILLRLLHRYLPPAQPRKAPHKLAQRIPTHLPRREVCEALPDERQSRRVVGEEGVERRRAFAAGKERGDGLLEEYCAMCMCVYGRGEKLGRLLCF